MKKIIATHVYNDFSGSPLVLSNAIKGLIRYDFEVELMTSDSEGFLSNLNVQYNTIEYSFKKNKFQRLWMLLLNQWMMFWAIWNRKEEDLLIYVNTLLPFGAALAGKLTGQKVIYHIHETSIRPRILKGFLKAIAGFCSSEMLFVSEYLQKEEAIAGVKSKVVYNALSPEFTQKAKKHLENTHIKNSKFTVLMLCSLKAYKGVDDFVNLAQAMPDCNFEMVLNAEMDEIKKYFLDTNLPDNLVLFPVQKDVHWFYQRAHLVVNLSDPSRWVETFGMTLLEGMVYGVPVFSPVEGGPTELVEDGKNGFRLSGKKTTELTEKINYLKNNSFVYQKFSINSLKKAQEFSEEKFINDIIDLVLEDFIPAYNLAA